MKPSHLTSLFGEESGIKGVIVSALAGILSVGPIYAWYPLLKELKARGAKNSLIAIFLNNRAVKPVLLPIVISYFGGIYVFIFTLAPFLFLFCAASWLVCQQKKRCMAYRCEK